MESDLDFLVRISGHILIWKHPIGDSSTSPLSSLSDSVYIILCQWEGPQTN